MIILGPEFSSHLFVAVSSVYPYMHSLHLLALLHLEQQPQGHFQSQRDVLLA
jgi:hypothetical protein